MEWNGFYDIKMNVDAKNKQILFGSKTTPPFRTTPVWEWKNGFIYTWMNGILIGGKIVVESGDDLKGGDRFSPRVAVAIGYSCRGKYGCM